MNGLEALTVSHGNWKPSVPALRDLGQPVAIRFKRLRRSTGGAKTELAWTCSALRVIGLVQPAPSEA